MTEQAKLIGLLLKAAGMEDLQNVISVSCEVSIDKPAKFTVVMLAKPERPKLDTTGVSSDG